MNNHIERSIREKYIDNLLKNSQDWDWYINYLEENFDINYEVHSLDDFKKCYVGISDAFDSILRINQSIEKELPIGKLWLKTLNEISLFYLGKIDYSDIALYDAFFKTLALLVYTAKIYNETTHGELLWYSDIFQYNNLYKLFSMDLFITNADTIISGLNQIGYITDSEKEVFQNNINEVFIPCNSFLDEHRSSIVCADCFNFRSIDGAKCSTWEEKYLHEMIQTEYAHGKMSPMIGFKDGHTIPDFSAWTSSALDIMKYDLHDEDATFIIESIEYALYNTVPSSTTILKHAQMLFDYWTGDSFDSNHYFVSSFEFLITFFNDKRIQIDGPVFKLYHSALKTIADDNILLSIHSRCSFRDKGLRKRISEIIDQKKRILSILLLNMTFYLQWMTV